MSTTTKKGGTLGVSQKVDRNDASTGGGSKEDSIQTTPSKAAKLVTKKALATSTSNKGGNEPTVTNPAILNQQALEALYSATYVEDFIDCNDNMGDDLIRQTTRMFEMGSNYMTYIRELETAMAILLGDDDGDQITPEQLNGDKKKAVFRLQQVLITAQDTGDDSLQVMQGMQDHIENKTRQLDVDRKNLAEFCKEQDPSENAFKDPPPPTTERSIKRARRQRHEIYRPSILGPSSLKATSYPETVSTNSRDQETHIVTSSRSRDRSSDSHNTLSSSTPTSASTAATTAAAPVSSSSSEPPINSTVAAAAPEEPPSKPNGRTSERSGGSSSRSSTTAANAASAAAAAAAAAEAEEKKSSTTEKSESRAERISERSSGSYNSSSSKKQSQRHQTQEKKTTKKRKAKQSSSNSNSKEDNSPQQYAIDPDEPTYCLCDQVSYGEMIGCDNDLCPIEWFHFSCVSLTTKPKGKWYCPKCRGDRPNLMKPKAIFLKELEKYNREKEEKA